MTAQTTQDEVQPGEKAPAHIENTADALKYPPPQQKFKPYKVLFIIACVCFVVGLLSIVIGLSLPPGPLDTNEGIFMYSLTFLVPLFAFVSVIALCIVGLLNYLIDIKSR